LQKACADLHIAEPYLALGNTYKQKYFSIIQDEEKYSSPTEKKYALLQTLTRLIQAYEKAAEINTEYSYQNLNLNLPAFRKDQDKLENECRNSSANSTIPFPEAVSPNTPFS